LEGVVPTFEMRFRRLRPEVIDVLNWNVFGEKGSEALMLAETLGRPDLFALEVLDRGTKGLGGPTRNDLEPPPGEPTDYIDFVLNIGAPPEEGSGGGGTYGFGKTAAYLASACSTIIIWSRSRQLDGEISERFIASAMDSSFSMDGQRYTGRQWWGLASEAPETHAVFRVEPVQGDDARRLGEAVFERHFGPDETGTSILILRPRFEGETVRTEEQIDGLCHTWAKAIARNLWPKLGPSQPEERRMDIRVLREGHVVPIETAETSTSISAATRCLNAIRAAGHSTSPDPLVKVQEVWCERPKQRLGHVALTKYLPAKESDPAVAGNSLIFMRNAAELVVWEDFPGPTADGLTDWIGVFKPVADLDQVFADAEPPAHDAWNPSSLDERRERTFVKLAVQRAREQAKEFRGHVRPQINADGASPTGQLSAALAGLTGTAAGTLASPPVSKSRAGSRKKQATTQRPQVKVLEVTPLPPTALDLTHGRQTSRVLIEVSGRGTAPLRVFPSKLSLAVDGGVMPAEGQVELTRWSFDNGPETASQDVLLPSGARAFADISFPSGLAVEFDFTAEES